MKRIIQQSILIIDIILFWVGATSSFFFEWKYWSILVIIGWILSTSYPLWKK